jgi:regulator of sigma E protease
VSVPALGIAYPVLNTVANVLPDSPASAAGIAAGDVLVEAKLVPPDEATLKSEGLEKAAELIDLPRRAIGFDDENRNAPYLLTWLHRSLPGTQVKLTLRRGKEERTVTLGTMVDQQWFDPMRGLNFQLDIFPRKAESFADAVALGYDETIESLLLIYRTLQKLSSGQVSAKNLIGPVGIVQVASHTASQGMGELLVFLCILSANLAILNFLPIPVLDGGHMVFLLYEWIRGKPPSEGVFLALSYLGLAFILALMVWVIGLDLERLFGG